MNMITRESQLKHAQEWIEKFKTKIHELEQLKATGKGDMDTDISIARNHSELKKLEQQIAEYKSLCAGSFEYVKPQTLNDIPETLIKLRIALGWSQKKLAEETGLDQQAISRYELNNYEGVSYSRLLDIADAFKAHFCIEKFRVLIEETDETVFQLPQGFNITVIKKQRTEIQEEGVIIQLVSQPQKATG